MHSGGKKGNMSTHFNARNREGEKHGRNYSRGRPRSNPPMIFDLINKALADSMQTVATEASRGRRRRRGRNQHKSLGQRQTHIEDLNEDCLIHVFSFLPLVDRVRIQRVCKRWYTVSLLAWQTLKTMTLKEDLWGVHCNKSKITVNRDVFHQVLKLCGHFLTHIDLTKDDIGRIPRVRIESCKAVIKIIEATCPKLRSLDIARPTTATAIDYITDHFLRLTGLTMSVSASRGDYEYAVEYLFSYCKNLKYLNLMYSKISATCLLNSNFENLEELHLCNCKFETTESILNVIYKLKALHTLTIEDMCNHMEWEEEDLRELGSLTNLKKLNLAFSNYYTSIDTNFICYLANLEELKLRGPAVANDEVLEKISRKCRNIKKLQLFDSHLVTDDGISYIAKFPRLEYLHFKSLKVFNCKNLAVVSQIKYLKCIQCPHILNEGFIHFIANSENIRWIKVLDCGSISEELIAKANNIASEKLYITFDNTNITNGIVYNMHSLNKVENQIVKKFEKLCIACYRKQVKNCQYCLNKVEVF